MTKPKEQAKADFLESTRRSWTYQRMTEPEKAACEEALTSAPAQDIQGTYRQRWSAYAAIYHAFLLALGYDGFNWREPANGDPLPFVCGA